VALPVTPAIHPEKKMDKLKGQEKKRRREDACMGYSATALTELKN
jgi:hypothetical protein